MLCLRIIVTLLVHRGLVKMIGFKEPKYVGNPINVVKIFDEKEVDELVVLDIDAMVLGQEPNYQLIANPAAESRMPLAYSGGVKNVEQAKRIVGLGVEKVALNSITPERPSVLFDVADAIGRQSVVIVLDAKRRAHLDEYGVLTHNGKRRDGRTVREAASAMERAGIGEIVVNSIDKDGRTKGYDLELARKVRSVTSIPVTVLGGAGSLKDIGTLIENFGVIGAAAGSLFIFKGVYRAVLINYPRQVERAALVRSVLEIAWKKELAAEGLA